MITYLSELQKNTGLSIRTDLCSLKWMQTLFFPDRLDGCSLPGKAIDDFGVCIVSQRNCILIISQNLRIITGSTGRSGADVMGNCMNGSAQSGSKAGKRNIFIVVETVSKA